MKRTYDFPLPYHISGIQDSVGVSDLQSAGLWAGVPTDLQARLTAADSWFSGGVDVTQSDLDELPDDVWAFIAGKLGLSSS
jgi:hypothetical protein